MRPTLIALGGLVIAVSACASSPAPLPAASGPAVATAPVSNPAVSPTASASSTVPSDSGGYRWTPVDLAQFGGVHLDALTTTADARLLALGDRLFVNGGPQHPTAWLSSDGLTWTRLPPSDAFAPPRQFWHEAVLDLALVHDGYIAVGMEQEDDGSNANAAAWYSGDGTDWTRAAVADATGRTMDQVIATPSGLVALGEAGYSFHAGMGFGTAIWTSPDGRSWKRVPAAVAPPVGTRLRDVVAVNGGLLAAAGFEQAWGGTQGQEAPVTDGIWRSTDAVHWQAVPGSPLGMAGIARTGEGLVAVGSGQAFQFGPALVWRSTDGTTWSGTPLPGPSDVPAGVEVGAQSVVADPVGLLAFGEREDTYTTVAWSSQDGTAWSAMALPIPVGTTVDRAYDAGSFILVVGRAHTDSGAAPAAWRVLPEP